MRRLDEAILAYVEKLAHGWQKFAGHTNFFWARAFSVVALFFIAAALRGGPQAMWPILTINASLSLLNTYLYWGQYAIAEDFYQEGSDTAHPLTLLWRDLRFSRLLAWMILILPLFTLRLSMIPSPLWPVILFYYAATASLLVVQYVRCVIPLPPGISKIRQWLIEMSTSPLVPIRVKEHE